MITCPATGRDCQRDCDEGHCQIQEMATNDVSRLLPSVERHRLIAPEEPAREAYENVRLRGDFFIIVYPASDLHHRVAVKLAQSKPGQMVAMTPDEMSLLTEFIVWPKQQPTASF